MPAERHEELHAHIPGGETVLLGWIIRVSDGDVIGFEPVRDEQGEAVYQLGHHLDKQVTFLEEGAAEQERELLAAAREYRAAHAPLEGLSAAIQEAERRCFSPEGVSIGTTEDRLALLAAEDALSAAQTAAAHAANRLKRLARSLPQG